MFPYAISREDKVLCSHRADQREVMKCIKLNDTTLDVGNMAGGAGGHEGQQV